MEPSNCIICSRHQIVKRACVSLLSKHTHILFWTGPTCSNLVHFEGPEIDFDTPRASGPPVLGALLLLHPKPLVDVIFLAFDFCRFCVVIWFFHPCHNCQWPRLRRIFYPRCYPLHLFSYLNSWERASIFPFECSVLNKGTTGTIFIMSLVWRGPWLGIEANTIPLGYRGGGTCWCERTRVMDCLCLAVRNELLLIKFKAKG